MEQAFFDLFDYFDRLGIMGDEARGVIGRWKRKQILDFALVASGLIPFEASKASSPFDFVANGCLSGEPWPCSDFDCRSENLDNLARFAALYGNRILVRDPLRRLYSVKDSVALDRLRTWAFEVAQIFRFLRPLMQAGLVGVARASFPICPIHGTHAPGIPASEEAVAKRLTNASGQLLSIIDRDVSMTYRGDENVMEVTGPESIIQHGVIMFEPRDGRPLRTSGQVAKEKNRLRMLVARAILDDVMVQEIYAANFDFSYLTDRDIDFPLIESINSSGIHARNRALAEGLTHNLPFAKNVRLSRLVALRQNEGEAFQVYRDSVTKVLKDVNATTSLEVREAFDDIIAPEVNKVAATVRTSRAIYGSKARNDLIIATGMVATGLFSGVLAPTVAAIVAAAGGLKLAHTVGTSVLKAATEPPEARSNPYYFLWKVRQAANR